MPDRCLLDGGEPLFERAIREQLLSHFHECAHDINAHRHGALAVENRRGHNSAVLGKKRVGNTRGAARDRPALRCQFWHLRASRDSRL